MDGYQDVYGKNSYFDYRVSEPGTEIVLIPSLHDMYEKISFDKEAQTEPGLFLLLNPGWYFLLYLLFFMYLWREKKYQMLVPMLSILLYMGTLFLGPIALVRYALILFFAFPIYSAMLMNYKREKVD